jgi:hypothetical protein
MRGVFEVCLGSIVGVLGVCSVRPCLEEVEDHAGVGGGGGGVGAPAPPHRLRAGEGPHGRAGPPHRCAGPIGPSKGR